MIASPFVVLIRASPLAGSMHVFAGIPRFAVFEISEIG